MPFPHLYGRPSGPHEVSDDGLALLVSEESCILHPYKDQLGLPSIGIGHLIRAGEKWGATITKGQAWDLLRSDLHRFERAINARGWTFYQNEYDAMVSLIFNEGEGPTGPLGGILAQCLDRGSYEEAAQQFLRWRKGGGRVLPVLEKRRALEASIFLQRPITVGDYAAVGLPPRVG